MRHILCNSVVGLLFMLIGTVAMACPEGYSSSSFGVCLPNAGGSIGKQWDQSIKNLANELGKTPEALNSCIANLQRCAVEITSAPFALPLQAYMENLYSQSNGRTKRLSPQFVNFVQLHYDVNLTNVTYAVGIDTGHGMTVAYCDRIFFAPNKVDPWNSKDDLYLVLHELEHLGQCQRRGKATFLAEYMVKVGVDVIRRGTVNVHDVHDYEVAANNKANALIEGLWGRIQNGTAGAPNNTAAQQRWPATSTQRAPGCQAGEVYMAAPGGACCTSNYAVCRNLTTGAVTCGIGGC